MRKNIQRVVAAFCDGINLREKTCRSEAVGSRQVIFSYEMPIACSMQFMTHTLAYVISESECPTKTTTSQIRAVQLALKQAGWGVVIVVNLNQVIELVYG